MIVYTVINVTLIQYYVMTVFREDPTNKTRILNILTFNLFREMMTKLCFENNPKQKRLTSPIFWNQKFMEFG